MNEGGLMLKPENYHSSPQEFATVPINFFNIALIYHDIIWCWSCDAGAWHCFLTTPGVWFELHKFSLCLPVLLLGSLVSSKLPRPAGWWWWIWQIKISHICDCTCNRVASNPRCSYASSPGFWVSLQPWPE